MSLVVLGSFGLSEFSSVIVAKREENNKRLTVEEALKATGVGNIKVDVQEEYERMMDELDIEHWENIRGPRPWEEPQDQVMPKRDTRKKKT